MVNSYLYTNTLLNIYKYIFINIKSLFNTSFTKNEMKLDILLKCLTVQITFPYLTIITVKLMRRCNGCRYWHILICYFRNYKDPFLFFFYVCALFIVSWSPWNKWLTYGCSPFMQVHCISYAGSQGILRGWCDLINPSVDLPRCPATSVILWCANLSIESSILKTSKFRYWKVLEVIALNLTDVMLLP